MPQVVAEDTQEQTKKLQREFQNICKEFFERHNGSYVHHSEIDDTSEKREKYELRPVEDGQDHYNLLRELYLDKKTRALGRCKEESVDEVCDSYLTRNTSSPKKHYNHWLVYKGEGEGAEFVGRTTLRIEVNNAVNWGIALNKNYRGKGIGKIIGDIVQHIAFEELGFDTLYASALRFNQDSHKLMLRLGMKPDGIDNENKITTTNVVNGKAYDSINVRFVIRKTSQDYDSKYERHPDGIGFEELLLQDCKYFLDKNIEDIIEVKKLYKNTEPIYYALRRMKLYTDMNGIGKLEKDILGSENYNLDQQTKDSILKIIKKSVEEYKEEVKEAAYSKDHPEVVTTIGQRDDDNEEIAGIVKHGSLKAMLKGTIDTTAAIVGIPFVKEIPSMRDGEGILIIDSDSVNQRQDFVSHVEVIYRNIQGDTQSCADNALCTAVKARALGLRVFLYEHDQHLVTGIHYPLDQYPNLEILLEAVESSEIKENTALWNRYTEVILAQKRYTKYKEDALYLGNTDKSILQGFNLLLESLQNPSIDVDAVIFRTEALIQKITSRDKHSAVFLDILSNIRSQAQEQKAEIDKENDSLFESYEGTSSVISKGIEDLNNIIFSGSSIVSSYVNDLISNLRNIIPKTILEESNLIQAIGFLIEFQASYRAPGFPGHPSGPDDDPGDWGNGGGADYPADSNNGIGLLGNDTQNYKGALIY